MKVRMLQPLQALKVRENHRVSLTQHASEETSPLCQLLSSLCDNVEIHRLAVFEERDDVPPSEPCSLQKKAAARLLTDKRSRAAFLIKMSSMRIQTHAHNAPHFLPYYCLSSENRFTVGAWRAGHSALHREKPFPARKCSIGSTDPGGEIHNWPGFCL